MATDCQQADQLLLDLFGEGGHPEPYPLYHALRELAPVHHSDHDGVWYLARYEDCQTLLLDPRCGHKRRGVQTTRPFCVRGDVAHRFTERVGFTMLLTNPPDHTRLRGALSRHFSARRVESLRKRIAAWVDAELDRLAGAGEVDLMDTLAFGLPATVMGDLLGVPEADRDLFRGLVVDPFSPRPEATDAAVHAYLEQLVADRRRRPGDDLISALILAGGPGPGALDEREIHATVALLCEAGFTTARNLIGSGTLALARHPQQAARLWANPGVAPAVVEEALRYESPIQVVTRHVLEPIEISQDRIGCGETVVALVGAANRDPARFGDPDRFEMNRQPDGHLGFGWGPHYCLGAALARLEGQIVFERMATRLAPIQDIEQEAGWLPSAVSRGLAFLRVRLAPKPSIKEAP